MRSGAATSPRDGGGDGAARGLSARVPHERRARPHHFPASVPALFVVLVLALSCVLAVVLVAVFAFTFDPPPPFPSLPLPPPPFPLSCPFSRGSVGDCSNSPRLAQRSLPQVLHDAIIVLGQDAEDENGEEEGSFSKGRPGPSPAESVVLFPYSRSVLGGSPPGPGALVLQSCCVSSSSPTVSRASSNSLAPLPATTAAPLLPLTRWPGGLLPQCDQCHQDGVRRKHGFLAIELFFLSILQIGCCKTGSASFSRPHS
jgi:hypothetical protein